MRIVSLFAPALAFGLVGTLAAAADCTCRNRGVEVPEGKTACIKTSKGLQLALCEKNLNVTNWKFFGEGCPTAMKEDVPLNERMLAVVVK